VDRIAGSGGAWHTSYAPVPHFMTTRLRSFFLENAEYSVFDLRQPDAIDVEVWSDALTGRLLVADSPLALIREYTRYAGRMRPLPDWVHRGAIVGLQGGTQRVREALRTLEKAGVPLAAFWLQDWVGRRDTDFGQQLWWSWQLDRRRYPDWEELLEELSQRGVRVMTYVNPFLVDAGEHGARRDLLDEAREGGFLVQRPEGGAYWTPITFDAVLVDLTRPAARDWLARVIRDELVGVGASGWMADFGEALPWDAVLANGEPAARWHNAYPEIWAELNRRALREAGLEEQGVFFTRSGFTRSPRHATLFWLGDQLVSWDEHDGIKSAVTGLLSGGLSGFAFNHSDIGGYTTLVTPVYSVRRSKELLLRWIELGAFQVVFRTHEGNLPAENHQFDSDEETLRHFSRFARVHAAWGFYRDALIAEAAETGAPVVRHPWLQAPDEPWTRSVRFEQLRVGSELLVAPVLDPGVTERAVWLPPGRWVHLWSGSAYGDDARSTRVRVPAPIGSPPVFYKEGSRVGARFRANLERAGVLERSAAGS
jgi:alpha-glucosidase